MGGGVVVGGVGFDVVALMGGWCWRMEIVFWQKIGDCYGELGAQVEGQVEHAAPRDW